jgi:hypothetical protein
MKSFGGGWIYSFMLLPLYPQGKSPRYPLDMRLGGPQSRSGRYGEVKILDHIGTRTPTPRSSSPQPVVIPTELSRLPSKAMRFILLITVGLSTNFSKCPQHKSSGNPFRGYHCIKQGHGDGNAGGEMCNFLL